MIRHDLSVTTIPAALVRCGVVNIDARFLDQARGVTCLASAHPAV